MPINDECDLVIQDLFFYDFRSAYQRIMSSIDWDFSEVDIDNKEERNIRIGTDQRGNENLSSFLIDTVTSILDWYLIQNGLDKSNVIISQRDGFILNTKLFKTDGFMNLDFRGIVQLLIISPDRKKYLAVMDDRVDVKGISNRYSKLDKVYDRFRFLNLYDRSVLFSQLQVIKNLIMDETDKEFFLIPHGEDVAIQSFSGPVIVSGPESFVIDDVKKELYFKHYVKEFIDAIFLHFY